MAFTEELLLSAMNDVGEAIVIYDENDNFLHCNEANRKLYPHLAHLYKPGVNLREIITLAVDLGQFLIPETEKKAFIEERIKHHWVEFHETVTQLADGRWVLTRNRRLKNGLFVGTRADITEIKQREIDLEAAKEEAEAATKAAKLAERAKSEFLANMSHEIRTPMNGVMGMAELLIGTELAPKQKMFADTIIKSGSSLLTIINDILDFSKIDAGQLELTPAPFRLADAIEDVATMLSTSANEKQIELAVRIDPGLPAHFVGDVGRLRQIVTNLLGNAVKFTDTGEILVNVEGSLKANNTFDLNFSVRDTGSGIPKDKCRTIFEKFSQVDSSATRRHEGTGLGLSIASSLVQLMGGTIGVESELGVGSTFWFNINLPVEGSVKLVQKTPLNIAGARVVIIDDNAVNRSILAEQMEAWSFEHAELGSGKEGLSFMRQVIRHGHDIDLLILDYQMPDMSGLDVLREMRSDPTVSQIPVILLSSVDEAVTRSTLAGLQLEASLTKPTRSSVMMQTVSRVISEARSSGQSEAPLSFAELVEQQKAIAETCPVHRTSNVSQHVKGPNVPLIAGDCINDRDVESPKCSDIDILVAEDNEVNQMLFTQILESTDHTFKVVDNGEDAVEFWKLHNPALILMDISMPKMNGHEATMAIRAAEADTENHVPIVAVTAHALSGDEEQCFESGMDEYITKPISVERLKSTVEKHCKTARNDDDLRVA